MRAIISVLESRGTSIFKINQLIYLYIRSVVYSVGMTQVVWRSQNCVASTMYVDPIFFFKREKCTKCVLSLWQENELKKLILCTVCLDNNLNFFNGQFLINWRKNDAKPTSIWPWDVLFVLTNFYLILKKILENKSSSIGELSSVCLKGLTHRHRQLQSHFLLLCSTVANGELTFMLFCKYVNALLKKIKSRANAECRRARTRFHSKMKNLQMQLSFHFWTV